MVRDLFGWLDYLAQKAEAQNVETGGKFERQRSSMEMQLILDRYRPKAASNG